MMMASVLHRHHHHHGIDPSPGRNHPPTSTAETKQHLRLQDFLSPLSYSRSVGSDKNSLTPPTVAKPTMTSSSSSKHNHRHRHHNDHHPPPPPPSIQKSLVVDNMAQLSPFTPAVNVTNGTDLSRLLSFSSGGGGGGGGVMTPRSILSSKEPTSTRKQELQEVLQYIDGMNFMTPYSKQDESVPAKLSTSTWQWQWQSQTKPPRAPPNSVLMDRSNTTQHQTTMSTKNLRPQRSARDPTPSKPKVMHLDQLQENPQAAADMPDQMMSSPFAFSPFTNMSIPSPGNRNKNNQSSLIVELSQETVDEEQDQGQYYYSSSEKNYSNYNNDPPTEDSKVWTSPPRRRIPLEPEPTKARPEQEASILLGTAFADCDLVKSPVEDQTTTRTTRHPRPPPIQTSWAVPLQQEHEAESYSKENDENLVQEEDQDDYSDDTPAIASLHLPATPAAAAAAVPATNADVTLEELAVQTPETPRDVKKWLQTAAVALQEARTERDAARQWARDMREAVHKWAEEQRKLIRCETSTQIDALDEREQQTRFQSHALSHLETMVQQLYQDFQSTHSQRQASDSQLQQLIMDQQVHIQNLTQQLASVEQTVNENLSTQAQGRTPKSELSSPPATAIPHFVPQPHPPTTTTTTSQKSVRSNSSSSRIRKPLPNGDGHVIVYSSGVEKEVHKDGTTVTRFTNGDVETDFGSTVAYFHASEQVLQINNSADQSVLLEYPNGQIERHYANGTKAILFADGTKAKISADGKVETYHRV